MDNPSRRQWLIALMRTSFLALIAAVCALLIRRSSNGSDGRCAQGLPCQRCGSLPGCGLPRAVAWKQRN